MRSSLTLDGADRRPYPGDVAAKVVTQALHIAGITHVHGVGQRADAFAPLVVP